jgi:hypothetical protein
MPFSPYERFSLGADIAALRREINETRQNLREFNEDRLQARAGLTARIEALEREVKILAGWTGITPGSDEAIVAAAREYVATYGSGTSDVGTLFSMRDELDRP